MQAFFHKYRTALLLSLLYFVPGMAWVLLSDMWLFSGARSLDAEKVLQIDKIKDASFVTLLAVMIFFMIHLSRKKLLSTRMQYQHLFEQNPNPMWIYELGTLKFIAVNNAAIRQYGYTNAEFLSMTLADIRTPDQMSALKKHIASIKPSQVYRGTWLHRKKSGEIITVEILADDISFFNKSCRLVCATDITEKLKTDVDNGRLSLVAKNATNSVIITTADAKIEWVNDAFTTLTGYTMQEVLGRRPSDFLHGPDTDMELRDEIFSCVQAKQAFTGEILNYRKDGSAFWLRLTVSPVITNGEITNIVTVQTDITGIKEQNNQLKDIAFTASHGFRKPLANILGLLELVTEHQTDKQVIFNLKKSAQDLDAEIRVIVEKTSTIHL